MYVVMIFLVRDYIDKKITEIYQIQNRRTQLVRK